MDERARAADSSAALPAGKRMQAQDAAESVAPRDALGDTTTQLQMALLGNMRELHLEQRDAISGIMKAHIAGLEERLDALNAALLAQPPQALDEEATAAGLDGEVNGMCPSRSKVDGS